MNNKKETAMIMTWYATQNYGTLLQGFATKEIFENRYNYKVYFVKYTPVGKRDIWSVIKKCVNPKVWKRRFCMWNERKKIQKYNLCAEMKKREDMVEEFVKHYNYADEGKVVRTQEDFLRVGKMYDLYISGSDQIWNPQYLNERFLLDFVDSNKKCISFASSLSCEQIPSKKIDVYRKLLNKYSGITVREVDCVKQLSDIVDCNVSCILDPTLVYGADNWKKLQRPINEQNYILLYLLGKDAKPRLKAVELAKVLNKKLIYFPQMSGGFTASDIEVEGEPLWECTPFEWLSYIQNADYVLTDSFHMTVFSIMFHKNFHVIVKDVANSQQNNRIINLLKLLKLEDRFIDIQNIDEESIINTEIDWELVDSILENERKKSLNTVDSIIEKVRGNINYD